MGKDWPESKVFVLNAHQEVFFRMIFPRVVVSNHPFGRRPILCLYLLYL